MNDLLEPTGADLKKAGQELVVRNERIDWRLNVLALLQQYASSYAEFTADQFRRYCAEQKVPEPHHHNVWGALFTTAHRRDWIRPTGQSSLAKRKAAHARACTVWRSTSPWFQK